MADQIVLNVEDLTEYASEGKVPALTRSFAGIMQEAIVMCMREHHHSSGITCDVKDFTEVLATAKIVWVKEFTNTIARAFGSTANAAERAGEGIAILSVLSLTDFTVIERSITGTGVDFWLGNKDNTTEAILQRAARMEVKGRTQLRSESKIRSVLRVGMKQTDRSAATKLPACVILTEFSRPVIYMVWA